MFFAVVALPCWGVATAEIPVAVASAGKSVSCNLSSWRPSRCLPPLAELLRIPRRGSESPDPPPLAVEGLEKGELLRGSALIFILRSNYLFSDGWFLPNLPLRLRTGVASHRTTSASASHR